MCTAELGLNADVTELLNECEQPGLVQSLLLPEDLALRHLPALNVAHRRLDFTRRNPSLTPLQEVHTHTQTHTDTGNLKSFTDVCWLKSLENTKGNSFTMQITIIVES